MCRRAQGFLALREHEPLCLRDDASCLCPSAPSFPLDTSRRPMDSEREGQGYSFVSRAEMEADIRMGDILGNMVNTRATCTAHVSTDRGVCCWPGVRAGCQLPGTAGPPLPSLLSTSLGTLLAPQYFPIYFHTS